MPLINNLYNNILSDLQLINYYKYNLKLYICNKVLAGRYYYIFITLDSIH